MQVKGREESFLNVEFKNHCSDMHKASGPSLQIGRQEDIVAR